LNVNDANRNNEPMPIAPAVSKTLDSIQLSVLVYILGIFIMYWVNRDNIYAIQMPTYRCPRFIIDMALDLVSRDFIGSLFILALEH